MLVSCRDQLEKHACFRLIFGDVGEIIEDEQSKARAAARVTVPLAAPLRAILVPDSQAGNTTLFNSRG